MFIRATSDTNHTITERHFKDAAHANDILALTVQLGYGADKVTAANSKTCSSCLLSRAHMYLVDWSDMDASI